VSVWAGRVLEGAFSKAYLCLVEDPFDSTDNTARTVGSKVGHATLELKL